ncbi:ubiquitin carboxyl-terminal hydrolase 15 [Elysia marginata]|uniref:ubiquitinyl hydrolase 1 n=1 Tax=Elysia marginata TaxID=1093978 RepID=A0AAV4F5I0_9GAST|nr:ubiquitin carboxyl-terminal hydrolase 15 [Elysia marginata]
MFLWSKTRLYAIDACDRTHVAVDWSKAAKDRFYDDKAAESFEEHLSMKYRGGQKKPVIQLHDCLKLFMKEEQLSEQDPWYCPDCKLHKQATKKFDLWSLPDVLIIHLKRFHYNSMYRNKIDALVEFPTQGLDLSNYIINEESPVKNEYDLIAVTNHFGGLGGGHYTAYAKNKDDKTWYCFDDSSVSGASPESVASNTSAYVLVYQRTQPAGPAAPRPATETLRSGMIPIPVVHIQNNDISTHSGGPSSPKDLYMANKQENGEEEADGMDGITVLI